MSRMVTVSVDQEADEAVMHELARCLRGDDGFARQLRDFAHSFEREQRVQGIYWQPKAGHILICRFGLGFRPPEMVKTRPVIVISPKVSPWTRLCVVLPISSTPPDPPLKHHYKLPDGLVPGAKYSSAWIKGDTIMAVGAHRLDRMKTGFRSFVTPVAPPEVLAEARRCALHAIGMSALTEHW